MEDAFRRCTSGFAMETAMVTIYMLINLMGMVMIIMIMMLMILLVMKNDDHDNNDADERDIHIDDNGDD